MTNEAGSSDLGSVAPTPTSGRSHLKRPTSKYRAIGVVLALAAFGGSVWTATAYETADETAVVHMEASRTGAPRPGLPGHPIRKIRKIIHHITHLEYEIPATAPVAHP